MLDGMGNKIQKVFAVFGVLKKVFDVVKPRLNLFVRCRGWKRMLRVNPTVVVHCAFAVESPCRKNWLTGQVSMAHNLLHKIGVEQDVRSGPNARCTRWRDGLS